MTSPSKGIVESKQAHYIRFAFDELLLKFDSFQKNYLENVRAWNSFHASFFAQNQVQF